MSRASAALSALFIALATVLVMQPHASGAPKKEKAVNDPSTNRTIRVLRFQAPQYDTNGVKTAMLTGKEAVIYPDRMVEISELGLDILRKASTNTDVKVTSPKCFYNPEKGYAVSEDTIRIARENMVITGSNYIINAKEDRMQINHDVKIVFFGMRAGFDQMVGSSSNAPAKKKSNAGN